MVFRSLIPLQQTRSPESHRCRLQYQLLIPIFREGSQCPLCLRELDVWGDHAVNCISWGHVAIVGRYYSARNGLDTVLASARQRVTGNQHFLHPSLAMNVAARTFVFTDGKQAVTFTSMSSVRRLSLLPNVSTKILKISRPGMPSCLREHNHQWPFMHLQYF